MKVEAAGPVSRSTTLIRIPTFPSEKSHVSRTARLIRTWRRSHLVYSLPAKEECAQGLSEKVSSTSSSAREVGTYGFSQATTRLACTAKDCKSEATELQ